MQKRQPMDPHKNVAAVDQERGIALDEQLPKCHQMVVISDGVYEGDAVEGVRYPSPQHMSGWWLTTDRYNGDVGSLRTVHFHHIAEHRLDLLEFLKLPIGYRFFSTSGATWFDHKVADAEP